MIGKRAVALTLCAFSVMLAACKGDDDTAPARTHSVTTTANVPANPTAPITLSTRDPESEIDLTLDVASLQAIVQAAGGAAKITMTDLAPTDFSTLPATERALVQQGNLSMATLVFDIQRSAVAVAGLNAQGSTTGQGCATSSADNSATNACHATFKIKNSSGRRCTPGVVDFFQVFGTTSTKRASTIVVDDEFPLQNIRGDADVALEVLHFIFDWECPRVTPTGSFPAGM